MGTLPRCLRKCLALEAQLLLVWISSVVIVSATSTPPGYSVPYPSNMYAYPQATHHSVMNTTGSAFEPRGDSSVGVASAGFGTTGGSYGVGVGSVGSVGGYDMGVAGGYGPAVAAAVPAIYKYQVYPNKGSKGQKGGWGQESQNSGWGMESMGWGDDDDDDDDHDFPKELIGLLGLLGLKGLKSSIGIPGLPGLGPGLFLFKKLLKFPILLPFLPILAPLLLPALAPLLPILLPLLLPLLIPLLIVKLAKLVLLVAGILLLPVLVVSVPPGRALLGTDLGRNMSQILQQKVDTFIQNLPTDLRHIVDKIKDGSNGISWMKLFNPPETPATAMERQAPSKKWADPTKLGDKGNARAKLSYVLGESMTHHKPVTKSTKIVKLDKSKNDINKT